MASLTLFTCNGEQLNVSNLPADQHISIEIPHAPEEVGAYFNFLQYQVAAMKRVAVVNFFHFNPRFWWTLILC